MWNKTELKVKWAAVVSLFLGSLVAVANAVQSEPGVLSPLPAWGQFLVLAVAPAVAVWGAAYSAPHTAR